MKLSAFSPVLLLLSLGASAADPAPSQCGNAQYAGKAFAPRLQRAQSRITQVCQKFTDGGEKALNQLAAQCDKDKHDSAFTPAVMGFTSRTEKLCQLGKRTVTDAATLCHDYDSATAQSTAALSAAANAGTSGSQSHAFSALGAGTATAGALMTSVHSSAVAYADRMKRNLPKESQGPASQDPEIETYIQSFKALAASGAKVPSCQKLANVFSQAGRMVQENLMPNMRVIQGGVENVVDASGSKATALNNASAQLQNSAQHLQDERDASSMGNNSSNITGTDQTPAVLQSSHVPSTMNQANPADSYPPPSFAPVYVEPGAPSRAPASGTATPGTNLSGTATPNPNAASQP